MEEFGILRKLALFFAASFPQLSKDCKLNSAGNPASHSNLPLSPPRSQIYQSGTTPKQNSRIPIPPSASLSTAATIS